MRQVVAFAFVASLVVAVPAAAQSQPQPQAQPKQTAAIPDPDQVICEKEDEIGSRLSSHKVCHTRSQWQQLRSGDRSATERVQTQRSMDANGH